MKLHSLIINYEGEGTATTYNGRSFFDYPVLMFAVGTATDVRASIVMASSSFQQGINAVITVLHGSNQSSVTTFSASGTTVSYLNGTSVNVNLSGMKMINILNVYGICL